MPAVWNAPTPHLCKAGFFLTFSVQLLCHPLRRLPQESVYSIHLLQFITVLHLVPSAHISLSKIFSLMRLSTECLFPPLAQEGRHLTYPAHYGVPRSRTVWLLEQLVLIEGRKGDWWRKMSDFGTCESNSVL